MTVSLNGDALNSNLLLHLLTYPGNFGTTWNDLTSGNHNATLPSGAVFGTDQRPGGLSGAVRLGGVNYPTIPASPSWFLSNFTVALWAKLAYVSAPINLLSLQTGNGGLWFYGPNPQLGWAANGSAQAIYLPWFPQADRWYHIAYTHSNSVHQLFIDGVSLGSMTNSVTQAAATNGISIDFPGHVDDIRIWSTALSPSMVQRVYQDSLGWHCGTLTFTGWSPESAAVGFLGDSLVAGYLLDQKPGDIAASVVRGHGPLLLSSVSPGISGATTADYLPGSPHLANAKALFERYGIRHVMVMLGTNDCNDLNAVTPTQYRNNMLAICRDLTADGYIVVLNYPPAFVPPAYTIFTSASLSRLISYQPVIDSLVNGTSILHGDTSAFTDFSANSATWIQADNIHLTPAGNTALANRWANVMLNLL